MKFNVNVKDFLESLSPAIEVSTQKAMKEHEFANKVTLLAKKGKIECLAFNGRAAIVCPISDENFGTLEYLNEEEGEVTVNAKELKLALSSLPSEKVKVVLTKGELNIFLCSDEDYKRSIATYDEKVVVPHSATEFESRFLVNREEFISSVSRVEFAPAVEDNMECYKCVYIEVYPDRMQISAGSGGRFAVDVREGESVVKELDGDSAKLYLHNSYIKSITNILSGSICENVEIKYAKADPKKNVPEQVSVSFDGFVIYLYGMEIFQRYPDMKAIIGFDYPNKIFTKLSDWKVAVSGVEVTMAGYEEKIHNTEVSFDEENERLIVESQTKHKSRTPVAIDSDLSKVTGDKKVWFRCNSEYLREMVTKTPTNSNISLYFESQAVLDDIPEGKPLKMKPVLVKCPEIENVDKGVKENFYMFFGLSTKEA